MFDGGNETHPEFWYWQEGQLQIHLLRDGRYQRSNRSLCFPKLDISLIASFLGHPTALQAVRAFRAALNTNT